MKQDDQKVDILAVGAHPDDVELTCGGTLARMVKAGHTAAILDLTRGEMGTRGTVETRAGEAKEAGEILGVTRRMTLDIPDGSVTVNPENISRVVSAFRTYRPSILLIPHSEDRHPDHCNAHRLCREAWFSSGLKNFKSADGLELPPPHRPDVFFEFMQWFEFIPSFIVDVTETYDLKKRAILAFRSQFYDPNSKEPQTKLSQPQFLELLEIRARAYGEKIGARYGEPFFSVSPVGVDSLFHVKTVKG